MRAMLNNAVKGEYMMDGDPSVSPSLYVEPYIEYFQGLKIQLSHCVVTSLSPSFASILPSFLYFSLPPFLPPPPPFIPSLPSFPPSLPLSLPPSLPPFLPPSLPDPFLPPHSLPSSLPLSLSTSLPPRSLSSSLTPFLPPFPPFLPPFLPSFLPPSLHPSIPSFLPSFLPSSLLSSLPPFIGVMLVPTQHLPALHLFIGQTCEASCWVCWAFRWMERSCCCCQQGKSISNFTVLLFQIIIELTVHIHYYVYHIFESRDYVFLLQKALWINQSTIWFIYSRIKLIFIWKAYLH